METLWERLESWLRQFTPEILVTLHAGVTEDELRAAEEVLQLSLPETVRDFYRIHNGQATDRYGFTAQKFLYGWETPNLKRIVQSWQSWKEVLERGAFQGIESIPDDGARNDWWNVRWIPITQNSTGGPFVY